ncbi:MAG: hypothetical protein HQM14_02645 [SAR324 cluster bacterium]|nr:hypothetical protein [SAR324 cluster bacterium]
MKTAKVLILMTIGCLLYSNTVFAEFHRIRLLAPVSEQGELDVGDSDATITQNPTTSGFGLYYVMPFGLGIGYSTLSTTAESEFDFQSICCLIIQSMQYDSNFVDISYTIGEAFSFTLGAGLVIDGSAKLDYEAEFISSWTALTGDSDFSRNFNASDASGNSWFVLAGMEFEPMELILGYRANSLSYKFDLDDIIINNSSTFTHKLETAEILAGIGVVF